MCFDNIVLVSNLNVHTSFLPLKCQRMTSIIAYILLQMNLYWFRLGI